jgi:hypothetical protein
MLLTSSPNLRDHLSIVIIITCWTYHI